VPRILHWRGSRGGGQARGLRDGKSLTILTQSHILKTLRRRRLPNTVGRHLSPHGPNIKSIQPSRLLIPSYCRGRRGWRCRELFRFVCFGLLERTIKSASGARSHSAASPMLPNFYGTSVRQLDETTCIHDDSASKWLSLLVCVENNVFWGSQRYAHRWVRSRNIQ